MNELPTGLRPTLEDENGKPLADLGLLARPTHLAIVSWLLVFFISDAKPQDFGGSEDPCSATRKGGLNIRFSDTRPRFPVTVSCF